LATSTTAAQSPAVGASAGDADITAVAAAVAVAAATTSCCGSVATVVPRGGSPVILALPAACGALDEHRLVGTSASDLSALAGARAGRSASPCERENTRMSTSPSKPRAHKGSAAHLKLEKPRFLFPEGSGSAAVVPADAAVALAGSSTDGLVVGACSTSASAARGHGGGGFHLS
jgi:hypothetical protein